MLLFSQTSTVTPDFFFFQGFAKNSLIKNIFEEEKKFDSRTWIFFWKQFRTGCILPKAKLTAELSQKVHYSHNQGIKDGVNEAILLM